MLFNKYYTEELAYLKALGEEFARANPGLAQFLDRDSADPDVQRLIEGFAFIAGRLREKIDDELPELSHSLFDVIFPQYLQPIPPASVVAFEPLPGALSEPREVKKGSMLETGSLEGTRCRFSTRFPVTVRPLQVASAVAESSGSSAALTLRIETVGDGVAFEALELDTLRLYLRSGSVPAASRWLFLFLTRYLVRVTARDVATGETLGTLGPGCVTPVGLDGEAQVLDYPANAFPGFKLVQEYFAMPSRFMFLDVDGLGMVGRSSGRAVDLAFDFDRPFPADLRVGSDVVRLHATPVLNAFPQDGEPVTIDHRKTEYRVRAAARHPHHYEVVCVDRVTGWVQGRGARVEYPKFESFAHTAGGDMRPRDPGHGGVYVRTRRRPSVSGTGVDTFVSFVRRTDVAAAPPTEVASFSLTCTNGPLVDRIGIGAVCEPTADVPPELTFRNVEPVSAHVPPPVHGDVMWRLIANLSLGQTSIVDREVLCAALAAYDFGAIVDERRRERLSLLLGSIRSVRAARMEVLVRGLPVRGSRVTVEVDETRIGGPAEAHLFGVMLDRFLASYSSVNSCHRLVLGCTGSNAEFEWPVRSGWATLL